jgi:biopolymer transport protein ExbB
VIDAVVQPLLEYVELGGYVMPPLIAATLALWFGLGYRISVLRQGRGMEPRLLVSKVRGGTFQRASSVVERAAVIGVQMERESRFNLRAKLDDVFSHLERDLQRYAVLTTTIVAVAPLLGLLGTVSGMIETFASLGDMTLFSQSGGIAGGISQALLTTQFGLTVSIPGLITNGLLARRQKVLETQIEEIKDLLCVEHAQEPHS